MNNGFYPLSTSTSLLKMPGLPTLRKLRGTIDGYGDAQQGVKARMHRNGLRLLRFLAQHVAADVGPRRVYSNLGGPAVSGEVTLHTAAVWAQVSCCGSRVVIMYRRPASAGNSVRWDSDGTNRFVYLDKGDAHVMRDLQVMLRCFALWEEKARRELLAVDVPAPSTSA